MFRTSSLGLDSPLSDFRRGVFLKPSQQTCLLQETQIVGEGGGVAGILKLPEHFLIGEHLSRIVAAQLKKATQQGRLVNAGGHQHVS